MNLITAFCFETESEMEHALRIALYDMENVDEDYHYCVIRERGHELLRVRESGLPYLVVARKKSVIDLTEATTSNKFTKIESNFDLDKIEKDNCRILCRGFNAFDGLFDIKPLLSQDDDAIIKKWCETLDKSDIGRSVRIVDQKYVSTLLFSDEFKPFFVKTYEKGSHYNTVNSVVREGQVLNDAKHKLMLTKDRPDLSREGITMHSYLSKDPSSILTIFKPGYTAYNPWHGEEERYPDAHYSVDGDMIVSDVINIQKDDHGTMEYRVFVIGGKVSSISRYLDFVKVKIPHEIKEKAESFVSKYRKVLPDFYVVDFALTDEGISIVELNPYERSGRYFQNSASNMFKDLKATFECTVNIDNSQVLVPEKLPKLSLEW